MCIYLFLHRYGNLSVCQKCLQWYGNFSVLIAKVFPENLLQQTLKTIFAGVWAFYQIWQCHQYIQYKLKHLINIRLNIKNIWFSQKALWITPENLLFIVKIKQIRFGTHVCKIPSLLLPSAAPRGVKGRPRSISPCTLFNKFVWKKKLWIYYVTVIS